MSDQLARKNILGLSQPEMATWLKSLGEKPFRAQQIIRWIHKEGVTSFSDMTNLSQALRAKLETVATITPPKIHSMSPSSDGTRKWLFEVAGGGLVETVYIPERNRATLCISSQVGCILNCSFCHTAKQGFEKNMTDAEIIGQLWHVVHALKREGVFARGDMPVTNVVMMGMGEPLMNFEPLVNALGLMRDDHAYGLAKRRVTVSTSGVVPKMYALYEKADIALAVSLHAPTDDLRDVLVPLNKKYPLETLLKACKAYTDLNPRHQVTMEYVMIDGVNDQPSHAKALCKLLANIPVKINLIPFNPFPGTEYRQSTFEAIKGFQAYVSKRGYVCTVRKTRGDDILAACGQLAGEVKDRTKRAERFKARIPTTVTVSTDSLALS